MLTSEFYLKIKPKYAISVPISTCKSKDKVIIFLCDNILIFHACTGINLLSLSAFLLTGTNARSFRYILHCSKWIQKFGVVQNLGHDNQHLCTSVLDDVFIKILQNVTSLWYFYKTKKTLLVFSHWPLSCTSISSSSRIPSYQLVMSTWRE